MLSGYWRVICDDYSLRIFITPEEKIHIHFLRTPKHNECKLRQMYEALCCDARTQHFKYSSSALTLLWKYHLQHMFCKYSGNIIYIYSTCFANTHNTSKNRKALQILTTQAKTEKHRKYSQHKQKQKSAANTHNTTKYRKAPQILTTQPNTEKRCKYSQHKQKQKNT